MDELAATAVAWAAPGAGGAYPSVAWVETLNVLCGTSVGGFSLEVRLQAIAVKLNQMINKSDFRFMNNPRMINQIRPTVDSCSLRLSYHYAGFGRFCV